MSATISPSLDSMEFDADLVHGFYVQVAAAFLRSPSFSAVAKTLYGVLLTYAGQRTVAWPGQATLCKCVGVTDKTLRKALGELAAAGLVTVQRLGDGKTARYRVRKWESDESAEPVKKQNRKNSDSEPSRTGKIPHELNTVNLNRNSGGYARGRTPQPKDGFDPQAAAATAIPDGAEKPPVTHLRERPASAILDGVALIDADPQVLQNLTPEEGLRRFKREHPEKWEAHRRFREIEQSGAIRAPRLVQWREAQAVLEDLRDERAMLAAKPAEKKAVLVAASTSPRRLLSPRERAAQAAGAA